MNISSLAFAFGLSLAAGIGSAAAADIAGAGASFPYPVYAKWAEAYKAKTGVGLNYQSIGSGGGVKQIVAKTVTFGASDAPLKAEELEKNGLVQFPTVMGGVVPVVNAPDVKPGDLTLDGQTLADIFQGKITAWNDPAIAKLNPNLALPSSAIAVVHRSDGSGTSFVFTTYLSQTSKDWADNVGAASAVEWPVGIGAKGNEGVANTVAQTDGSIGYVEYAYAKQNSLAYTKLINKDGKTVEPTAAAFESAAQGADWEGTPGYGVILTDEPGAATWPITSATFILIHKQPDDPAAAGEALKFFDWAYGPEGDELAKGLDYIPMPDAVVEGVKGMWSGVMGADGKPAYTPAS